jgi:hypothetical protein
VQSSREMALPVVYFALGLLAFVLGIQKCKI